MGSQQVGRLARAPRASRGDGFGLAAAGRPYIHNKTSGIELNADCRPNRKRVGRRLPAPRAFTPRLLVEGALLQQLSNGLSVVHSLPLRFLTRPADMLESGHASPGAGAGQG